MRNNIGGYIFYVKIMKAIQQIKEMMTVRTEPKNLYNGLLFEYSKKLLDIVILDPEDMHTELLKLVRDMQKNIEL